MGVCVYLDEVDRHYEVAKEAGAEIAHCSKDVYHGQTDSAVDPEGPPGFFTSPPKVD
jgi:hypothetical protein